MTVLASDFSIPSKRSAVIWFIFSTGTPLIVATVSAMSCSVTEIVSSACDDFHASNAVWKAAPVSRSCSRKREASSKSPFATASSFRARSASIFSCIDVRDFGRTLEAARRRAPVSSRTSIALSGSCRAGRYRAVSSTAARSDSSENAAV